MEIDLWLGRFEEYLAVRNYSRRTVEGHLGATARLLEFLEGQGLQSLSNLTRAHLEGYRTHLFYRQHRGRSLTVATQSLHLSQARQFVRFLFLEDFLLLDVGANLELPRVPEQIPRIILSEHETIRLLELPDTATPLGLRNRALLEVLYGTGIRNSELCQLQLDELDFARHLLRVEHGKGNKQRVVPLGEEAEAWLGEYLQKTRPRLLRSPGEKRVFLTQRGPFDRTRLAILVGQLARKAGLQKHTTPHVLRHSCATHMLARGADLRFIQAMLGHSSPDTTQRYTRVEVSDLRRVILRCHPREQVQLRDA